MGVRLLHAKVYRGFPSSIKHELVVSSPSNRFVHMLSPRQNLKFLGCDDSNLDSVKKASRSDVGSRIELPEIEPIPHVASRVPCE